MFELLSAALEQILENQDITVGFGGAPSVDQAVMAKPGAHRVRLTDSEEALHQGAEGWADESYAMRGDWDFDPSQIKASVTWWHGDDDRNAPLSAARRAVARIPGAQLRVWHGEGHLAPNAHEAEVITDLLSRSQ